MCFLAEPFAIGFTTKLAHQLLAEFDVVEAFVDSTFKTNSSSLELFTVLGSLFGTGFPLAYFLMESQISSAFTARQQLIHAFFMSLSNNLPRFKPMFFSY